MKKINKSRIVVFFTTIVLILSLVLAFGKNVVQDMKLGLDLRGGFAIVYEVEPLAGEKLPDLNVVAAAVRKRVDVLGVNEPNITIEGDNRIRVELAGVKDQEQARKIISSTANLTFRDVDDKLLLDASSIADGGASLTYDLGRPQVSLKIKDKAKFAAATKSVSTKGAGKNIMVTWLDFVEGSDSYAKEKDKAQPKYISAATVTSEINGDAVISGSFTSEQAKELASLINAGSLPVKMKEIQSNVVSAQFGERAYAQTMVAGMIGIVAVMIFMIAVYRIMGLISAITLTAYTFFVVFLFNLMGGTFTLSGIAALVLGVGMTVDASVISFERIKDSLYAGRSVKAAVAEGNKKAFSTIFDSQVTTFIAAVILFILGEGSIKGFATMLMMTVVGTFVINVVLVKFLLNLLVNSNLLDDKKSWFGVKSNRIPDLSKGEAQFYFGRFMNVDFVKWSKKAIWITIIVFVVGIGSAIINRPKSLNLGIDFTSGSKVSVQSTSEIVEDEITKIFTDNGYKPSQVRFEGDGHKSVTLTFSEAIESEKLVKIKQQVKEKYNADANDSIVSPKIGQELARSAVIISIIAWIAIMIYISIRFKWDYAISGIVALVHDVLFLVAIFAIVRFEINIEFIAIILSIIGYSIDDTIVIFDRIRENVDQYKRDIKPEEYRSIVNKSLQQVLLRSLINTFTTILPLFFLLSIGAPEVFVFNFGMLVGLLAGAYSSIFIAAQIWLLLRIKFPPKYRKHHKKLKKIDPISETIIPGIND